MIDVLQVASKKTRAFGWVQDAGNLDALCNVVAIFDETSPFHKSLVQKRIPELVGEQNGRAKMIAALNGRPLALSYKLLIGSHTNPRSESPCDGIVQAAVKGQKREYIGDWPADNFVRWAQAFGFIAYNYADDTFSITGCGKSLLASSDKKASLIQAALSYPPAYRILSLLKNPADVLTKFELGEKLGFTGEDGFTSYPLASIVAAMASAASAKERGDIRADWESSSDKYARTIAQWLVRLGLLKNIPKEISVQYGDSLVSDALGGFGITPSGERHLRNASGNSRHGKIPKIVSYEMFATKGGDREYLRLRRSLILKAIVDGKNRSTFAKIQEALKAGGLDESIETIKDDVAGFMNLGLNVETSADSVSLQDAIADFSIPVYKDLTIKSELSKEKDKVRMQLKSLSHEYLSLMDLAFDPKQNRLFEIKAMDLFLNECGFYGRHLGGANKPDGVLYTDEPYPKMSDKENYGIIVDMKAYSGGYNLPIAQQDEMKRYIGNNQKRDEKINPTKWLQEFPDYLAKYYFMFVSGSFKGDVSEKLHKMYLETKTCGTALSIVTALLVADKIKSGTISKADFEKGFCNAEYRLRK